MGTGAPIKRIELQLALIMQHTRLDPEIFKTNITTANTQYNQQGGGCVVKGERGDAHGDTAKSTKTNNSAK